MALRGGLATHKGQTGKKKEKRVAVGGGLATPAKGQTREKKIIIIMGWLLRVAGPPPRAIGWLQPPQTGHPKSNGVGLVTLKGQTKKIIIMSLPLDGLRW
jgi:hypothetical protein